MNDMIVEFWNKHAKGYGDSIRSSLSGDDVKMWRNFIFKWIDSSEELNILDIGTGPGFFPAILTDVNRHVTGIDLSGEMVKQARENLKLQGVEAEILNMDCHKTEFEDDTFDVLICRNLVWTLSDPMGAYREWRRILKPKGRLLIFDGSWYAHHYFDDAREEFERKSKELFNRTGMYAYNYGDIDTDPEDYEMRINLFLSDKKRPEWDCDFLKSIGFQIFDVKNNYLEEIMKPVEMERSTDISPVFFICALNS